MNYDAPPTPTGPGWGQSLYSGAAGVALLHAVRAHTGEDEKDALRPWAAAMLKGPIQAAAEACGLYEGAPAVAYVLSFTHTNTSTRALATLDTHLADVTRQRLQRAHARIDHGALPTLGEYDLISGLTGLGVYHLHRGHKTELRDVLVYLARLTEPITIEAQRLPGWWTGDSPDLRPTPRWPGGHGNFGLAHGITGPLALLATALRHGHTVPGQTQAITRICDWLDRWRNGTDSRAWWPDLITRAEHRRGELQRPGPRRPSWCYGTPGIARAQQLAGLALGDSDRQRQAEQALAGCLADDQQLAQLTDASLCHGWAGLIQTVSRAAADALNDELASHLRGLNVRLNKHLDHHGLPDGAGLMGGTAGIHLVRLTDPVNTAITAPWDRCLLLTG
ncbi:lanthionine synthetase C family protein [Streptomyces sp. S.PNR 29]|uniref:lanthionine synthetase C family protein n=1 Tax=Streptomyces sp. S.PNR 29 TaxID=2973805 RepID=UPI0025B27C50|nr:lanthionine synthetase C family protein [Streptomyces sp. S.PNR 29]MDN0198153.1 lanthionine synthetase C family protein [Streptomyces sp. S.PNR 29]